MRDDLRNNPDQFLVNLILMSVQFLKSHDRCQREIFEIRQAAVFSRDMYLCGSDYSLLLNSQGLGIGTGHHELCISFYNKQLVYMLRLIRIHVNYIL